jgi:GAF domain-containing protein
MAGLFELFTDVHSQTRFRLLAADGAVLAISQAYPDTATAAAAITDVRECAGTGLIQDRSADTPAAVDLPRSHWRTTFRTITALATLPGNMDIRPLDLVLINDDVVPFLADLATLAARTLPSAGMELSCRIAVHRQKKPAAAAGSEPGASSMEDLDNIMDEGPSRTAIKDQKAVLAANLEHEDRWPRFVPAAVGHGFRSILCVPLSVEGDSLSALTLYSRRPNAFSPEDIDTAEAFAVQASIALRLVLLIAHLKDANQDLTAALAKRTVIDTALGVVMAQNRCNHDAAFSMLQRASNTRNVKLRALAASIITSVAGADIHAVHSDA